MPQLVAKENPNQFLYRGFYFSFLLATLIAVRFYRQTMAQLPTPGGDEGT